MRIYRFHPEYADIGDCFIAGHPLAEYDGLLWQRGKDEEGRFYESVDVAPQWYEIPPEDEVLEAIEDLDSFGVANIEAAVWNEIYAALGIPTDLFQEHPLHGYQEECFVPSYRRRQGNYRSRTQE
jgi:hypothetical protein